MRFRRILTATCVVSPWNLCVGERDDCRWGRRVATRRGPRRTVERDRGHRTRRDSATFAPPGENQAGSPFPRARAPLRPHWSPQTGEPRHRRRRPMSEPPQPYTPYAASAPKPRPDALWFVLGAVLMLLGLVIGMVVIMTAFRAATAEDGVITANGQAAAIASPANRSRMLFVQAGHAPPDCDIVDGSGQALLKRTIVETITVTTGGQEWRAFTQIDSSGDGAITITCRPVTNDVAQVRVGQPV